MNPQRWQHIEAIFREAVELDGEARVLYLQSACRGDASLLGDVQSLLDNDRSELPLDGFVLDRVDTRDLAGAIHDCDENGKSVKQSLSNASHALAGENQTLLPGPWAINRDPVVGWLVSVEGPERGRDYRIRNERNNIGRASHMDIIISGDSQVSGENHAAIIYDLRSNHFRLMPGTSAGLTCLNGRLLDRPAVLHEFDTIQLGNTILKFVPLCGERFQWTW